MSELAQKIEALLFIATSPVSEKELKDALNVSLKEIRAALNELQNIFDGHGIFLQALAGGWTLATRPEFSEIAGTFRNAAKTKKIHLSRAAIETAAIIAYNQPATRGEIDEIRGVHSDSAVARLLENGLIKISGRVKKNGALQYMTTQKFLELFGIDELENLPKIQEISEIAQNENEKEAVAE